MKNRLTLFFVSLYILSFSQEKPSIIVDVSGSFSKEIISNKAAQVYGGFNFDIGTKLNNNKNGDFIISFAYQFSSNVTYSYPFDSISIDYENQKTEHFDSKGNKIRPYKSLQRIHLIGASSKYIFREHNKKVRPFLKIAVLSEVYSNYKNGLLVFNEYFPKVEPSFSYIDPTPGGEDPAVDYYYSHFYYSTPLVINFLGGVDIKLIKNLNLNIALGYDFRIMKVKYAEWKENDNVYDKLKTIPNENINSHMLDVQLGLTYAFSFKKKPTTPK
ncbi:hypothetical protein CW751_00455 [Brumimicrobium salinarum]|uniref:Outer membrane protein beta-barrel domain-containing protein n=1 Tax=Brumimicrobium salinarum TaxID=2058658 RepID=A0A2I0R5I5_9FLAO|nr:hypothetical protein [Brumimicrobium salinarum]PKR81844.1 hypothetical protein CW751_00455 [Brumimicrobium salinarum]